MSSELSNDDEFKEYRPLGPKRKSAKHYIVLFVHLVAAVFFFVNQLNIGFGPEFYGNAIVTPILLIINGFAYSYVENDPWYREQMVPFISRIISITEIESDRYCQYHRIIGYGMLIFGWFSILVCQWITNLGFTILPLFGGNDILIRLIGELLSYGLIFGPYLLYFLILLAFAFIGDKISPPLYTDIRPLLEIEQKWTKENTRRTKNPRGTDESKSVGWF